MISSIPQAAPGRAAPLKAHDTIVAVLFASRLAERLLRPAIRAGLTPNRVTWASLVLSTAAALAIVSGAPALRIPAALAVLAGFVADCLDGLLARETGRESDFGAYLDAMTDLVKVALLLAALAYAAGGAGAMLAGVAFLFFVLCQHHAHVVRRFPQRAQEDYEAAVTPWKARLSVSGQRIDVAFAVGEVLTTIALGVALGRLLETLAVLAVVLPVQFASYAIRFWRHRYRP